jgi:hypothetical protein
VGLASLSFSDIDPVVRFALVGATAVALAAGYTLGPGMALITRTLPPADPEQTGDDTSEANGLHGWLRGRVEPRDHAAHSVGLGRWALIVTPILLAMVPGVGLIRTDVRAVEFFNEKSMTRRAADVIDRKFGGISLFMIEVTAGPGFVTDSPAPVNDPRILRFLAAKRSELAQLEGVGDAYDYSQAFSMVNRIWHGDDPAYDRLPQNLVAHGLVSGLVDSVQLPFIEKLRLPDGRTAFLLLRTASMPSREYLHMLERAMAAVRRDVPDGVIVRSRTGLHTILEQDRKLVADQALSTALTLVAIFLAVWIVWREVWPAVAVTAASALPVLAMLGLAGYTDTSINSITMMTAAVVLGLAVDDCAHLLDAAHRRRRQGRSWSQAIAAALHAKRRPIICTTVILGSMLGLFALSSFPPVRHFGLLACFALAAALVTVLVLLPAVLRGRGG